MPLKPKTRPIGQHVVTTRRIAFNGISIPQGTFVTVEGVKVDENSGRVHYKIGYQKKQLWVVAADLAKRG